MAFCIERLPYESNSCAIDNNKLNLLLMLVVKENTYHRLFYS